MTRTTAKRRINDLLAYVTRGIYRDDFWTPIRCAFKAMEEQGFDVTQTGAQYDTDENGRPCAKTWTFQVTFGNKPLFGIITAHGAGTVADPLAAYDVSAYVS